MCWGHQDSQTPGHGGRCMVQVVQGLCVGQAVGGVRVAKGAQRLYVAPGKQGVYGMQVHVRCTRGGLPQA